MPLIKAHPKGTSYWRGSKRMAAPLSRATTLSKGMLEAPNIIMI